MKSLFSLIFLFLFANSAFAANLCDTSCNLTITFPTGGSIGATEALTFSFGTSGVLDLGATGTINVAVPPASTDFSSGGTLALAAGESISFDAGGSLDLGVGGAIDFTSVTVTTDGEFDLQIDSVAESVYVGDIAVNGTGTLKITVTGSNLELGALSAEGDIVITSSGNVDVLGSVITSGLLSITAGGGIGATNPDNNIGSASLTSDGDTSLSDVGSTTCTTSSDGSLTISSGDYFIADPTLSTCNTTTIDGIITFTPPTLNTIDIGTIGEPLTEIEIDGVLYQIGSRVVDDEPEIVLTAPDGTTGAIEFKDGEPVFVPDEKGSGAVGLLMILNLLLFVSMLRRYQNSFFFIRKC